MKRLPKSYLLILLILSIKIYCQDSDFILENLKAPSMPSAVIIGAQVEDINSPKSLKELEAAVFTNYLNSICFEKLEKRLQEPLLIAVVFIGVDYHNRVKYVH